MLIYKEIKTKILNGRYLNMTREEKIKLHELLGQYIIEELEPEINNKKHSETKNDFLVLLIMQNQTKCIKEIMETLVYDF
jgi:hypothetical protein